MHASNSRICSVIGIIAREFLFRPLLVLISMHLMPTCAQHKFSKSPCCRVSTQGQADSGLGIEAQRSAVLGYVKTRGGELVSEHVEQESGKSNGRPKLQAALNRCQLTGATLVVAKLDRLSRSTSFMMALKDSPTEIVATDMPHANKVSVGVMAVIAQYEREAISLRTKEALQAAKARGIVLGGKRRNSPDISQYKVRARMARQKAAKENAELRRDSIMAAFLSTNTLQGVADYLDSERITTRRGSKWTPTAVKRILHQLNLNLPKRVPVASNAVDFPHQRNN